MSIKPLNTAQIDIQLLKQRQKCFIVDDRAPEHSNDVSFVCIPTAYEGHTSYDDLVICFAICSYTQDRNSFHDCMFTGRQKGDMFAIYTSRYVSRHVCSLVLAWRRESFGSDRACRALGRHSLMIIGGAAEAIM